MKQGGNWLHKLLKQGGNWLYRETSELFYENAWVDRLWKLVLKCRWNYSCESKKHCSIEVKVYECLYG